MNLPVCLQSEAFGRCFVPFLEPSGYCPSKALASGPIRVIVAAPYLRVGSLHGNMVRSPSSHPHVGRPDLQCSYLVDPVFSAQSLGKPGISPFLGPWNLGHKSTGRSGFVLCSYHLHCSGTSLFPFFRKLKCSWHTILY